MSLPQGILTALKVIELIILDYPSSDSTAYWFKLVRLAPMRVWKKDVQHSFGDPLAYWLVGFAGSDGKGNPDVRRDPEGQLRFALAHGLKSDSDQPFRSNRHRLSKKAQDLGLYHSAPKKDSAKGTVEERILANQRTEGLRELREKRTAPMTEPAVSRIIIVKD